MPIKVNKTADQVIRSIKTRKKNFDERFLMALAVEYGLELTEAQRITPVWNPERKVPPGHAPGSLRASGRMIGPTYENGQYKVQLAFGGPTAPYALFVHEDPDAEHATGEWKYLETPLKQSAPYMPRRLANRMKQQ